MIDFDPDAALAQSDFDPDAALAQADTDDFYKTNGQRLPDGTYLVRTPTGDVHVDVDGNLIKGAEEVANDLALQKAKDDISGQEKRLAFVGNFQRATPYFGGAAEALKSKSFDDIVKNYDKGFESTKRAIETAEKNEPVSSLAGAVAPALVGNPGSALGRVGLGAAQSGTNAFLDSEAKLSKGELGKLATDTAIGAGIGAGFAGAGEAVGAGLGRLSSKIFGKTDDIFKAQTQVEQRGIEESISSASGKLGAETQKASRAIENIQRGAQGISEESGLGAVSSLVKQELVDFLGESTTREVVEQVAKNSVANAKSGKAAMAEAAQALKDALSERGTELARAEKYFGESVWKKDVLPRLITQSPRWGLAAVNLAAGQIAGAVSGNEAVGTSLSVGAVLGAFATPGFYQMLRNVAKSNRVRMAIASRLEPLIAGFTSKAGLEAGAIAGFIQSIPKEQDFGSPQLAAEQVAARAGVMGMLSETQPKIPTSYMGNGAPQTQVDAAIRQTIGVGYLSGAVQDHNDEMDAKIRDVLSGKQGKAGKVQQVPGDISKIVSDPNILIDRVSKSIGGLHDVAPIVSAEMTATAQRAATYLAKVSEVPNKKGPFAKEYSANAADMKRRTDAMSVINDPMSVFEFAANGRLTSEHVNALKAVYPALSQQMQAKIIELGAEHKGKVPYKQRIMLGLLSGSDLDGTVSSANNNQAAIQASASKTQNPQQPAPKSLTLAERTAPSAGTDRQRQ